MATVVARGRGKGIVVRVGNSSEIGRISQAISATPHEKTILEQRLDSLGKYLVGLAVVMCLIIIFISLGYRRDTKETILLGVSLAVSVIPESLVAVVTVAMALGVKRMAEQNAIVRKLPAVESLGSVGVICSDKVSCRTNNH
jgi:Ca2+-transporting ATPase